MRPSPALHGLADPVLGVLSGPKAEHRRLPAGADLFRQGEATSHVFTAHGGWSYRYRLLGDGRRQILGVVLPGELVGLPGAASGRHAHGVRAVTEAEFRALSVARLPDLLQEQAELAFRLLRLGSHELRMAERLAVALGRFTAEQKLAAFATDLRDRLARCGMLEEGGRAFAFPLNQAEVADCLGMTVVHLNRVLRRLEEEGTLRLRRGLVEILDEPRLRGLSCLHEVEEPPPVFP